MAQFIDEEGKQKVIAAVTAVLDRDGRGVELVESKFFKEYGSDTVELLIWKKGGVDLDDCERIHGAVSDALDELDELFAGPYNLKISSMGLDRPIVTDEDFRRALGTEIECKLTDKSKRHGTLTRYDEDKIVIASGSAEREIERKFLTKVQPYVRF